MVKVGDKVRIKPISDADLEDVAEWMANPSEMVGVVGHIGGDDDYPILVEFEKEDPEDDRVFPDFYREDELEVLLNE